MTASRETLVRARLDAAAQIDALTGQWQGIVDASRTSNADDEHDPEGPTIAFERAQVAALLAGARQRLADIDDALLRWDQGRYGVCEVCGRPVAPARLAVRPAARTCVTCAPRA
jgi:RNA polymerase-binding transcription factor DksA